MEWSFDFGWFMMGLMLLTGGTAVVVFYRQIAHNLAGGISSYDKVKLFGLVFVGLGLILMANLHTVILTALVRLIFPTMQ